MIPLTNPPPAPARDNFDRLSYIAATLRALYGAIDNDALENQITVRSGTVTHRVTMQDAIDRALQDCFNLYDTTKP